MLRKAPADNGLYCRLLNSLGMCRRCGDFCGVGCAASHARAARDALRAGDGPLPAALYDALAGSFPGIAPALGPGLHCRARGAILQLLQMWSAIIGYGLRSWCLLVVMLLLRLVQHTILVLRLQPLLLLSRHLTNAAAPTASVVSVPLFCGAITGAQGGPLERPSSRCRTQVGLSVCGICIAASISCAALPYVCTRQHAG